MSSTGRARRRAGAVALVFLGLGLGGTGVFFALSPGPGVARATAVLIAGWGAAWMAQSLGMRPAPEWRLALAAFTALAAGALLLLARGATGDWALPLLSVYGLLGEGIFAILLALRLMARAGAARLLAVKGVQALALGLVLLWVWPEVPLRVLSGILGANALLTGLALFGIAARSRDSA